MKPVNHKQEYGLLRQKTEAYALLVQRILDAFVAEISGAALAEGYSGDKWFSFDDYQEAKRLFEKLQSKAVRDMRAVVVNGITATWKDSNYKNDRLAQQVLGKKASQAKYERYFDNNEAALNSFIRRQRDGLNLSKRIWKLQEEFKTNLEQAISVSMGEGKSAERLSREIRQYLNEPRKLFRRLRTYDADGNFKGWKLSNPALRYNPGTGQYRSSYKNSMRLARTEINMAYRTADQERWTQFDFVVGYEIKRSMSSSCHCPRCDALAGKYPKDFWFTGWHPQCMCYIIPILKTEEELYRDDELIMNGEEPSEESANNVDDVPTGYKEYIRENAAGIEQAAERGTLPYFLQDNEYKQYLKSKTTDD